MKVNRRAGVMAALMFVCMLILPSLSVMAENEYKKKDIKAFRNAYNLILKENWKKASEEFNSFIKLYPESHYVDDALFWHCYCREKTGQDLEKVFSCYTEFIKKYKRSKWSDDARSNIIRIGHILAKKGKKEYITVIKAYEESQNADVKLAALQALEDIGDERSLKTIIDMYDSSADPKLKRRVINILEDFNNPVAFSKIKQIALTEKNERLRRRAIDTLSDINRPGTVKVLMQIVKSNATSVIKRAALEAMEDVRSEGSKHSKEALDALVEIVKTSKDLKLRKSAINSIEDFETPEAENVLYDMALNIEDADIACKAVEALSDRLKKSNPEKLLEVYRKNRRVKVRKEVIDNIEDLKSYKGIPLLMKLAETETNPELLCDIINGLEDYNRDEPVAMLLKFAMESKSMKVRKAAIDALEEIGSAKAREALSKILGAN